MSDDEIARLRAEMDQARESLREVAGALWTFYGELIEQGFKADQALRLTVEWFHAQLRGVGGSDNE